MENFEKILLKNSFSSIYHTLYFTLSLLPPFFSLLLQKPDLRFDRANPLMLSHEPSGSPPVERSMGAETLLSGCHMLTSKGRNWWPPRGMDCKHCGSRGPMENMNYESCVTSSNSFSFRIACWDFPLLSAGLLQEMCCRGCFAAAAPPPSFQRLKGTLGADNFYSRTSLVRRI